ncbi:LysR family transcriptional regulator [Burkholderia multivorans]|uniref:Transcriptional regulator, LysR family n=1 Tax=Burkholderia multivorans CGD2 TaxID=513052 RepID=B9BUR4_9BURK|nr:LysR family transcriptional regulator [Burkholderia multivorans]EEE05561.1 transcriptional regulator, LysR family [Burkholderia multivorans CGD2]EEE11833.1 transcriptional regulator, LysR family [Burkholderia multivorans CGD2M]
MPTMKESGPERYPDWDLLASWLAVVEAGSISDAADRLNISQAGVSQRIKALETLLDTTLLDRATRPARPTAAGQRLFEHATVLLQGADQMVESVRNVSRAKRIVVRLGCVDSFAATIGPIIIKALAGASHQIRLWSGITPTLDAQLEARQLDVAVTTSGSTPALGIRKQKLFSEPYFVVLPKGFEVDRFTTLAELSKHLQFIRYSARSVIGQHIDAYLASHAENIERSCEFDATDPVLSLVAAGLGFAITTPLCVWQSRHYAPDIKVVPLTAFSRHGRPYATLSRSFFLSYRENELGHLPADLYDLLRRAYERQVSRDVAKALSLKQDDVYLADAE